MVGRGFGVVGERKDRGLLTVEPIDVDKCYRLMWMWLCIMSICLVVGGVALVFCLIQWIIINTCKAHHETLLSTINLITRINLLTR